jgi:hypothetical protein
VPTLPSHVIGIDRSITQGPHRMVSCRSRPRENAAWCSKSSSLEHEEPRRIRSPFGIPDDHFLFENPPAWWPNGDNPRVILEVHDSTGSLSLVSGTPKVQFRSAKTVEGLSERPPDRAVVFVSRPCAQGTHRSDPITNYHGPGCNPLADCVTAMSPAIRAGAGGRIVGVLARTLLDNGARREVFCRMITPAVLRSATGGSV